MYTVFALFEAVVTSDYEPANIGPMMKGLMQRSNITTGGAYFEGSPVENFKKRVRALTAVGAAILVTVPEMYLLLFIIVEGHNLIGLAAVFTALGMVVLHVLMTSLLNGME
ncbi:hypothetical protein DL96DRAFT_1553033 [Flagelloscypha sp. PMI_526]|nr:hypothetical protein DL96DRAFT_1553033 [Flagelloscypha sp. PMI_526]